MDGRLKLKRIQETPTFGRPTVALLAKLSPLKTLDPSTFHSDGLSTFIQGVVDCCCLREPSSVFFRRMQTSSTASKQTALSFTKDPILTTRCPVRRLTKILRQRVDVVKKLDSCALIKKRRNNMVMTLRVIQPCV